MAVLDFRTVFTGHMISTILCAVVITSLWLRDRRRLNGLGLWALHFWLQSTALVLILLRGVIPDLVSMTVANSLVTGSLILLLMGLERYLDRVGTHVHNYIFLAAFVLVHAFFAVVQPSLQARNVVGSVAIAFMCLQAAWLLWRGADPGERQAARTTALVFAAYAVVAAIRIAADLAAPAATDIFKSGIQDTLIILVYQMLEIGLTFALVLMVNQRLFFALERDISERRLAEEALRRSEEKFSVAFENLPDAIVVTALSDGRIVEANESFYEMSGLSRGEAQGQTTVGLGVWADPEARNEFAGQLREHGRAHDFETSFRRSSGEVFPGTASGAIIEIGGEHCALTVVHDLTERRRAEEALRASEERNRTILHTAMDGFWLADVQGRLREVNEAYCRMSGYSAQELQAMSIPAIEVVESPEEAAAHFEMIIAQGEDRFESRHRRKDGSVFDVEVSVKYRPAEGGRFVAFLRDITERKQAEEALSVAMRDLERSNKDLEQFAYVASHDLQEPLRMVASFMELLRKRYQGKLDADADDFIGFAVDGATRMHRLLEALLDYSRVGTRGKDPEPVSSQAAVDQALQNLHEQILSSKAEVSAVDMPVVLADESQLMRVLQNLIGNAIKFHLPGTPPQVAISAERTGDLWTFSVADDGIGIAADDRERIFEIFTRTHLSGDYPGTGIGLSVCRRIVERLGGSIWVESSGDSGTVVCFTLPAAP